MQAVWSIYCGQYLPAGNLPGYLLFDELGISKSQTTIVCIARVWAAWNVSHAETLQCTLNSCTSKIRLCSSWCENFILINFTQDVFSKTVFLDDYSNFITGCVTSIICESGQWVQWRRVVSSNPMRCCWCYHFLGICDSLRRKNRRFIIISSIHCRTRRSKVQAKKWERRRILF